VNLSHTKFVRKGAKPLCMYRRLIAEIRFMTTLLRQPAAVFVALFLAACSRPTPSVTHAADPTPSVPRGKREVRLTGTLEALHSSKILVPQIWSQGGPMTLTKLIPNGSRVKEGDLVAVFDSTQQIDQARDAQAKFKRATVLARLNRDDDAIAAFTELTQTYPELPEPYNNLAALYAKQGRYTEARAALETAVKASPGYGLAYENLGDLYLRLADQAYRRAQSLGAGNGTTSQRIADIEKIVSPRKTAVKKTSQPAAEPDYTNRAMQNITNSQGFQFGGPNGSLATPPYVAPSQ